jgi:hypothetical protein
MPFFKSGVLNEFVIAWCHEHRVPFAANPSLVSLDLMKRKVAVASLPEDWGALLEKRLAERDAFDPFEWMKQHYDALTDGEMVDAIAAFSAMFGPGCSMETDDVMERSWEDDGGVNLLLMRHGVMLSSSLPMVLVHRVVGYCVCEQIDWFHYELTNYEKDGTAGGLNQRN